jgi:hypothetical protein
MFRNLFDPLERPAKNLRHMTLLQGTKAYGLHVRPLSVQARENRSATRAAELLLGTSELSAWRIYAEQE